MSVRFKEVGNVALEKEILKIARKHSLRLMGPNIQGFNYLPNNLCVMFMRVIKTRGPIAVISQSGSITTVLSEWAKNDGLSSLQLLIWEVKPNSCKSIALGSLFG